MRISTFCRKLHYWGSIIVAVPAVVIIASGLLLQVKKQWHWIQPSEQRGTSTTPQVSFEQVLDACAAAPGVDVQTWDDIDRIDVRPGKQLIKVTTEGGHEIQLDPADGRVLQVAVRRSDVIEALHDGSWFGDFGRYGVFLTTGVVLLMLWVTGLVLLFPLRLGLRRKPTKDAGPARSSGRE